MKNIFLKGFVLVSLFSAVSMAAIEEKITVYTAKENAATGTASIIFGPTASHYLFSFLTKASEKLSEDRLSLIRSGNGITCTKNSKLQFSCWADVNADGSVSSSAEGE